VLFSPLAVTLVLISVIQPVPAAASDAPTALLPLAVICESSTVSPPRLLTERTPCGACTVALESVSHCRRTPWW
jgi:hypothetical protein